MPANLKNNTETNRLKEISQELNNKGNRVCMESLVSHTSKIILRFFQRRSYMKREITDVQTAFREG